MAMPAIPGEAVVREPGAETAMISFKLPSALKERLKCAARTERRCVSNMLIVIAEEWLSRHESPPKEGGRKAKS